MARIPAVLSAVFAVAVGGLAVSACRAETGTTAGSSASTSVSPEPSGSSTADSPTPGAGGGSATPSTPGTHAPSVTPSYAAPVSRCRTAQLRASLAEPDGAAGNRYQRLTLRNVGAACRMWGWVGLQLQDSGGGAVPTSVVHAATPIAAFVLPSGGTATALLHWSVVPSGGESATGPCEPEATRLLVYPPGQTTARVPAWTWGPVCGHGRFEVSPMSP